MRMASASSSALRRYIINTPSSLLATITGKPLRELEGLGPNSHLPSR
jgi:hypothetical protein